MFTTIIPLVVLNMLGNPSPAQVTTLLNAQENIICWQTAERKVCFDYADEGTHLAIRLNYND